MRAIQQVPLQSWLLWATFRYIATIARFFSGWIVLLQVRSSFHIVLNVVRFHKSDLDTLEETHLFPILKLLYLIILNSKLWNVSFLAIPWVRKNCRKNSPFRSFIQSFALRTLNNLNVILHFLFYCSTNSYLILFEKLNLHSHMVYNLLSYHSQIIKSTQLWITSRRKEPWRFSSNLDSKGNIVLYAVDQHIAPLIET